MGCHFNKIKGLTNIYHGFSEEEYPDSEEQYPDSGTSSTQTLHPNSSGTFPFCMSVSADVNSDAHGPDFALPLLNTNLSPVLFLVMDLIGTSVAAVPTAKTSEKYRSSEK